MENKEEQLKQDIIMQYNIMARELYYKYSNTIDISEIRLIIAKVVFDHVIIKTVETLNSGIRSQNKKLDKVINLIENKKIEVEEV